MPEPLTKVPKELISDPVEIIAYVIGREPVGQGEEFQVCDDNGGLYPIVDAVTPERHSIDVGERALRDAAHYAVRALNDYGFEIVKKA